MEIIISVREGKSRGGGLTQSPLFANIFARLKAKICPKEADI